MGQVLPFTREQIVLDPEALALATSTYDKVVISSAPEVEREVLAQHVIRLVAEGERDPNVLYERALASTGIPASGDLPTADGKF